MTEVQATTSQEEGSSPPQRGGEVDRPKGETVRGPVPPGRRSPVSIARARALRRGGNMAEALLWDALKGRKLGGHKFVRQMPLGPYVADFACRSGKLVIELDGSQHAGSAHDRRRDAFMAAAGYPVLRFWSADALRDLGGVCDTILAVLSGPLDASVVAPDLRFVLSRPTLDHSER